MNLVSSDWLIRNQLIYNNFLLNANRLLVTYYYRKMPTIGDLKTISCQALNDKSYD